MADDNRVSFFGLGAMGGGMAINLAKSFHVTGFDVFPPLVDKLVSAGGHAGESPAKTASSAPIAVIMVATAAQTDTLLFDGPQPALPSLPPNAVVILCSTCPPSYPSILAARITQSRPDVSLLDCPVSGGTIRAANGTLSIFASGLEDLQKRCAPVLQHMSENLYPLGPVLGTGQKVKAIHQLLAATNIISASEAMGLAAAAGLDTKATFEYLVESKGASFMLANRGPHMLANDWTALSALAIIWKDALIVVDAANEVRCPVPLCAAAEQLYAMANARGLLRDDDAKCVTMYLPSSRAGAVAQLAGHAGENGDVTKESVEALLAGIHLAASVEAMVLCKALDVERKVMVEIISKAAGWCRMFTDCIPGMLEGDEWTLARCPATTETKAGLEKAVELCRKIGYPCQMGTTALNQFYFAELAA